MKKKILNLFKKYIWVEGRKNNIVKKKKERKKDFTRK